MSRRLFVSIFVVLSVIFVPVIFWFGLAEFTVPTAWGYISTFHYLFRGKARRAFMPSIYSMVFTAIFYGLARLAFRAIESLGFETRSAKIFAQSSVLAVIVACSFFKVLTYSSFGGQGGTYNFWGAAARAIERYSRP